MKATSQQSLTPTQSQQSLTPSALRLASSLSQSQIPRKYLNRRAALASQQSKDNNMNPSCSQPLIYSSSIQSLQHLLKSHSQVKQQVSQSMEVATTAGTSDQSLLVKQLKAQLGPNNILVDLTRENDSGKSKSSLNNVYQRAKAKLKVSHHNSKKSMFITGGLDESLLERKIEEEVALLTADFQKKINRLESQVVTLTREREYLMHHLWSQEKENMQVNATDFARHSILSQSQSAGIIHSCQQTNTASCTSLKTIYSIESTSEAGIALKIPSNFQTSHNTFQDNEPQVEVKPVTYEEKKLQIIQRNREANLKSEMIINNMQVDVEESTDEFMPHSNPPNACVVLQDHAVNRHSRNGFQDHRRQFTKLEFGPSQRESLRSFSNNPMSTMFQSGEKDKFQNRMSRASSALDLSQSDNADEISSFYDEPPLSGVSSFLRKVKHSKKQTALE